MDGPKVIVRYLDEPEVAPAVLKDLEEAGEDVIIYHLDPCMKPRPLADLARRKAFPRE